MTAARRILKTSLDLTIWTLLAAFVLSSGAKAFAQAELGQAATEGRAGYVVRVPLPIVGDRDSEVAMQLRRLSEAVTDGTIERPIVVLQFQSVSPNQDPDASPASGGSQFERCLALARTISDRETAKLHIVAYLAEPVEGHAVLPVLACQEIYAKSGVELGRAAVDSAADATVRAAYADMVSRGRSALPTAAVAAMLDPNLELQRVSTIADPGGSTIVTLDEKRRLIDEGKLTETHETIWNGQGLAAFASDQMRKWLWIGPLAADTQQLAETLGVQGGLRAVQQLPREWQAVSLRVEDSLDRQQTNQLIRTLQDATKDDQVNLIVFLFGETKCDFDDASRLASAIGDLRDRVYTTGIVQQSLQGPITLAAAACNETVLIGSATLGPDVDADRVFSDGNAEQRVLNHLASVTERPLPLLCTLVDKDAEAILYTHQVNGRKQLFTAGQVARLEDRDAWIPRDKVAGGAAVPQSVAIQYGLVNAVEDSTPAALGRLGLEQVPESIKSPWLDSSIQSLLAQRWVPRVLLMVGLMALMIELGNPGISVGGLVSGLCFLGYFWIEGLNGNVEWLEILLFLGGVVALGLEIFVLPGFGVFGITGLLMLFLSLVLAGQTFVWPTTSGEVTQLASNLFWVAFLGFAAMVGLLMMHKRLERLPMFRWMSLQPAGLEELEELEQREIIVSYEHLLGEIGTTRTRLNPSGKAQFGDLVVSVVGSGGLIAEGVPVQVVEVRGNLVIVEECA